MDVPFYLAIFSFALVAEVAVEVALGMRRMGSLGDVPPDGDASPPKVSVIIPARNEEHTIEPALRSVLALDYEPIEVLVVNDRSEDGTAAVLERMAGRFPRLRIFHVAELPAGWIGKNRALAYGAARATGDYLLFTDADIMMERSTLKRALNRVRENRLDHLSLVFKAAVPGGLLNAMILEFGGALLWMFKPWKAKEPGKRWFMGVGAFNLVRRTAYEESGGHAAVAMCPVDDIMLGKRIKSAGFRQECMIGYDFVSVLWYRSVGEMANGLMKNIFAGYDFRLSRFFLGTLFHVAIGIWPLYALFLTTGSTHILNGLIILIRLASFTHAARRASISLAAVPWAIVSPHLLLYVSSRAVLTTLVRGGITWRGTFYPLKQLRENRI